MKLATVMVENMSGVAVVEEDKVYFLPPERFSSHLSDWVRGDSTRGLTNPFSAQAEIDHGEVPAVSISDVHFMAPAIRPAKIVGIGLNYMDHCREQNVPVPDRPIVFTKFTSAICGPGDFITWDTGLTNQVDYEVELGVVIGSRAWRVSKAAALEHVFGYTIINDISARDLQFSDRQWVRAKSLNTFCPMGPVIVTRDEIPNPQNLKLKCSVNGTVLQDSTTAEMVFGVAELIARLSYSFVLEPGDVIATGTPDGVGVFRKPPVFLKDGDTVVAEIEGIGRLENTCMTFVSDETLL